jgi:tRNA threonylcarbamoyladenosine modification (KEOPS) complex Cgi121 subunit
MLHCLEQYGKYLHITGYNHVVFADAEAFLKAYRREAEQNVDIQFFDAQLIATEEHLFFAVLNALGAFENKTNISKSLAMEVMLYASAQRQIQKAILRCGIKPQTESMAVVVIGEGSVEIESVLQALSKRLGVEPDEEVLEMSGLKEQKIIDVFGIGDEELKTVMKDGKRARAVVSLVIERVALLATHL